MEVNNTLNTRKPHYGYTFWYLLKTDFAIFKQTIWGKLLDLTIWICAVTFVTTYLLPAFGLSTEYIDFLVVGLVGSAGLFELYSGVTRLVSDLEGINITGFYLTLPIPQWMIFLKNIIFYAFNTTILSGVVLPIAKILLGSRLDFSHMNIVQFIAIFLVCNLFYGAFTLFIATRVRGIEHISSAWMRFVFPLWYFGCFQFSWHVLYQKFPYGAMLDLLNPIVYIMEGTRAAFLGQGNFLNYYVCLITLLSLTVLCGTYSITLFKKKLDF